jgi:hypothetical protein
VEPLQEGIVLQQLLAHSLRQAVTTVELRETQHTAHMSQTKHMHAVVKQLHQRQSCQTQVELGGRVQLLDVLLLQLLCGQEQTLPVDCRMGRCINETFCGAAVRGCQ